MELNRIVQEQSVYLISLNLILCVVLVTAELEKNWIKFSESNASVLIWRGGLIWFSFGSVCNQSHEENWVHEPRYHCNWQVNYPNFLVYLASFIHICYYCNKWFRLLTHRMDSLVLWLFNSVYKSVTFISWCTNFEGRCKNNDTCFLPMIVTIDYQTSLKKVTLKNDIE